MANIPRLNVRFKALFGDVMATFIILAVSQETFKKMFNWRIYRRQSTNFPERTKYEKQTQTKWSSNLYNHFWHMPFISKIFEHGELFNFSLGITLVFMIPWTELPTICWGEMIWGAKLDSLFKFLVGKGRQISEYIFVLNGGYCLSTVDVMSETTHQIISKLFIIQQLFFILFL